MTVESPVSREISAFLARHLRGAPPEGDEDIFAAGYVTSLFAMQIVMFVESTFGVTVEPEDMEISNFNSVDALTHFVNAKQTLGRAA